MELVSDARGLYVALTERISSVVGEFAIPDVVSVFSSLKILQHSNAAVFDALQEQLQSQKADLVMSVSALLPVAYLDPSLLQPAAVSRVASMALSEHESLTVKTLPALCYVVGSASKNVQVPSNLSSLLLARSLKLSDEFNAAAVVDTVWGLSHMGVDFSNADKSNDTNHRLFAAARREAQRIVADDRLKELMRTCHFPDLGLQKQGGDPPAAQNRMARQSRIFAPVPNRPLRTISPSGDGAPQPALSPVHSPQPPRPEVAKRKDAALPSAVGKRPSAKKKKARK